MSELLDWCERNRQQLTLVAILATLVAMLAWLVGSVTPEVRGDVVEIAVPSSTWDAPHGTTAPTGTAATTGPDPATGPVVASIPPQRPQRLDSIQITPTDPPTATLPGWDQAIPAYRPGGACSEYQADEIARAFRSAGASDDTVWWALRMMSRESNCDHTAFNDNNRTRDTSFGLCQLNQRSGHFGSNGVLAGWDPWRIIDSFHYSLSACVEMWSVCGRGPWTPPYSCSRPTS